MKRLVIGRGNPAVIAGKIDEREWKEATSRNLSNGGTVFFKHDENYIYVAVRGVKAGWSHLYFTEGENAGIAVLHASAALGKVNYNKDKNNVWQALNSFSWDLRDPSITVETREKMANYLSKNNWVANNNNMGNPSEVEFQLKPQNLSNKEMRLAVVYATDSIAPQFFPMTLADDCLKTELISGNTPPNMKFDPKQWSKISLENSSAASKETNDANEISKVPDNLFAAMRAKNADAIRAVFLENGQLTALDKPRDGKGFSTTRNFSADAFARMISEAKAGEFIEKMPGKQVRIYGDSAVVSGRYTFHSGEKFSHCGTNAFHLFKTETGWKIANGTLTLETTNCESKKDFSAENKDASRAVDKLFELMAAHKPAEIIQIHTPESQLAALIKGKDGKDRIENLTREAFSKFFEKKTAEISEKMYEIKVKVDGDLATIDGRYVFTVSGKIQHCGMNSFHLVRTGEGWKLGNSISTIEPQGCTENEKAMVK